MNRAVFFAALLPIVAGVVACTATAPSKSAILFGIVGAYTAADQAAAGYEALPTADLGVKAQIKALDAQAYAAVAPIVADAANGGNAVTDAEIAAAQAALSNLTGYMTAHGVK